MRFILYIWTFFAIFTLAMSQENLMKRLAAIVKRRNPTLEDIKEILPANTIISHLQAPGVGKGAYHHKDFQFPKDDETYCDFRVVVL